MPLPSFTRRLLAGLGLCLAAAAWAQSPADAPLPTVQHGRIERWANMPSRHVDARHVDIWLPEGYSPARRYAVLYMHDGQMLYDARTTWNRQAWQVQDALTRLRHAGRIRDVIVVGVWNNGKWRHSEYLPQAFLPGLPAGLREALVRDSLQGKPQSDAYLRFLVEELKPAIDARYATRPDRDNTFLMGASMGGLISVYAMSRHPEVFGGAAGLSTHWVGLPRPNAALPMAALNFLREHLADPATHRLYQDHGTIELDALYAPYQSLINSLARERGYVEGRNFLTLTFEGAGHNETAWAQRLELPLDFLLRP